MRILQSFILRLMVDSDHPEVLRGSLQTLNAEKSQWSFHDETELLQLLKQLNEEKSEINHLKN